MILSRMLSISIVVLTGFAALSCGSNSSGSMGRLPFGGLQSITLSPAAANAQTYPNGTVTFVATGHYTDPAGTVTGQPQLWGVCLQNAPTTGATITQAGVAQCATGATGTYTVFASVPTECELLGPCGTGCTVRGTAQLTCP
ncbi:MAG: hypothetical protein ACRD28_12170 [Acidobacteriaceae bacterium]